MHILCRRQEYSAKSSLSIYFLKKIAKVGAVDRRGSGFTMLGCMAAAWNAPLVEPCRGTRRQPSAPPAANDSICYSARSASWAVWRSRACHGQGLAMGLGDERHVERDDREPSPSSCSASSCGGSCSCMYSPNARGPRKSLQPRKCSPVFGSAPPDLSESLGELSLMAGEAWGIAVEQRPGSPLVVGAGGVASKDSANWLANGSQYHQRVKPADGGVPWPDPGRPYQPRAFFTISTAALQLSRIWVHFFSAMASREAIHVPPTHATVFSAR
jgi:hypothetical protein